MENHIRIQNLKKLNYKAKCILNEYCQLRFEIQETYSNYKYYSSQNFNPFDRADYIFIVWAGKEWSKFCKLLKKQNKYLEKLTKINTQRKTFKLNFIPSKQLNIF